MGQPFKIYLAGPIANTTDFVARFAKAREEVRALGYIPVCPIELNGVDKDSRREDADSRQAYLKADIRALLEADGIYLLDGWWDSRGARMEYVIASTLDLLILYQVKVDQLAAGYSAGPKTFERLHNERKGSDGRT